MGRPYATSAHFLLVGDSADLATLEGIVSRLPVNAYGQIFVEVASELQIQRWPVPAGMTVSWLCRDRVSAERGSNRGIRSRDAVARKGELVARAVSAWVTEWMPERRLSHDAPYVLWIGCAASEHADALCEKLAQRIEHAHFHSPRARSAAEGD